MYDMWLAILYKQPIINVIKWRGGGGGNALQSLIED